MKIKTRILTNGAVIAAIYTVLTLISNMAGLGSGVIQVRISEALTSLPVFTPAAIPGLFVGCFLSNMLTGAVIWDVLFGSIATLIGAIFTRFIGKKNKFLAILPPIISNTVIIPFVLKFAYGLDGALTFFMFTVGIGEIISCGVLGIILMRTIEKYDIF